MDGVSIGYIRSRIGPSTPTLQQPQASMIEPYFQHDGNDAEHPLPVGPAGRLLPSVDMDEGSTAQLEGGLPGIVHRVQVVVGPFVMAGAPQQRVGPQT